MASFLPNLDGLQKILKSDTTFKEKLEMAKMGKSRQLAEQYLPALMQAKTLKEATLIQQAVTAEAAKYGLDDLTSKINPMYNSKKDTLEQEEKVQKGKYGLQGIIDQYGDNEMYNPFENKWTSVSQFATKWIKERGGIENAWMAKDELKDIVEGNLSETSYQSGGAGGTEQPTILTVVTKKTKKGNIEDKQSEIWNYDIKSGKLYFDKNKDNKISEDELASETVYSRDDVQKAMSSLRGEKEKEFDNKIQLDASARGWANTNIAGAYLGMAQEKHEVWKQNVKNKYVPNTGDVKEAYTKAFSQAVATKKGTAIENDPLWKKLNAYYAKDQNALNIINNFYNFGTANAPNIGSEQLKSLSSSMKTLLDGAMKNSTFLYGTLTLSERTALKEMYGAYVVAENFELKQRLGRPITNNDFLITIEGEKQSYYPTVFEGTKKSYYGVKDQEIATQTEKLIEEGTITREQATSLGWDQQ